MSNTTQQLKAQKRREQFADLLREMFQLNQPELDFGLYRIMHARKDDINRFIDKDLPKITQQAFSQFASQDKSALEQELETARKAAQAAGFDPEQSPKVQQIQAQLKDNFDLAREEGEVYDALITFFNRYYDEGDFLSRRVYKNGTYAIPYEGEEVVLHWANKDQYYIKSSETLRDYSFRLNPKASVGESPMRVHFKLVDAEAGAKDNNKEGDDNKRVFVLDTEQPFELAAGEAGEGGEIYEELTLRFYFRAATAEDWLDAIKQKATDAAQKKAPTQDHLRAIAVELLLGEESELPEEWKTPLAQKYRKADGELADYTMLQGQLNNYTKRNTFDYFIHKDLGGFLTRELDFYIKNELLDWDDIASLKNDTARLAPLLSKIEVIHTLAEKIIAFLAQLENFQKKLWLKKKFVTETNYCITVDRLAEHTDLLEEVFNNEDQCKAWEELYKIDRKKFEEDYEKLDWAEFLEKPEYRYLMLDTCHHERGLTEKLISKLENMDEVLDGVLLHSDNFQALNLINEKFRDSIGCVYLDPPYNTGNDSFLYKDSYRSSSWMSSVINPLIKAKDLLADTATLFISNDDNENDNLRKILTGSGYHFKTNLIWSTEGHTDNQYDIKVNHEYVTLVQKKEKAHYGNVVDPNTREGSNLWESIAVNSITKNGPANPFSRITLPVGFPVNSEEGEVFREVPGDDFFNELADKKYFPRNLIKKYAVSFPIKYNSAGYSGYKLNSPLDVCAGWANVNKLKKFIDNGCVPYNDGAGLLSFYLSEKGTIYYKKQKDGARNILSVLRNFSTTEKMKYELESMGLEFSYPKPKDLIAYLLKIGDAKLYLDFYAGSGTTAHAVIGLNRQDGGARKYLLIDMGREFDAVMLPRLKKVVYADSWKEKLPVANKQGGYEGISHCIKYHRMESYEDALGNIALNRSVGQQQLLESSDSSPLNEARQSYVLNYMLDVETRESPSLLNTRQFLDPTQYQLKVRSASGDETKPVNVDLLETFNYLLGLTVEHIAAPIYFEAEHSQGEFGRWQAKVKRSDEGPWWFRTVFGTNRNGQKVLVVWRNLPSVIAGKADGMQLDNAVLDAVLIEKLAIRLTESPDDEIDILYVNGDHNIAIPRNRQGEPMEQARVQLIEEAFHRLMFADTDSVH